jgi:hypothetical protein
MTLKDDLRTYAAGWAEVDAVVHEERRTAPLELRWQQLNAAYALAKGLNLLKADPSEMEVFRRWAKVKKEMIHQRPKA